MEFSVPILCKCAIPCNFITPEALISVNDNFRRNSLQFARTPTWPKKSISLPGNINNWVVGLDYTLPKCYFFLKGKYFSLSDFIVAYWTTKIMKRWICNSQWWTTFIENFLTTSCTVVCLLSAKATWIPLLFTKLFSGIE